MPPTPPDDPTIAARCVRVRGAREHNLKNVDVDVPRDALVVFSGVSGSGKSSLAFGTLYAEAQRRYFESVAPYARRLIDQVGVPDVDSIEGLPPAVALQQQRGAPGGRSSVGGVGSSSAGASATRCLFDARWWTTIALRATWLTHGPKRSSSAAKAASTAAGSDTLHAGARPFAPNALTAAEAASRLMSTATTCAPAAPKCCTTARPMP